MTDQDTYKEDGRFYNYVCLWYDGLLSTSYKNKDGGGIVSISYKYGYENVILEKNDKYIKYFDKDDNVVFEFFSKVHFLCLPLKKYLQSSF